MKPVRDDSGLSMLQLKHINTDQKMEWEETQQEAASGKVQKETKTEKERTKTEKNKKGGSTGQKKQKEKRIKRKSERENVESKEMLHSEIKKGEDKDETQQSTMTMMKDKKTAVRRLAKGISEEIKDEGKGGEKQESVTDKEADTYETQKKHKKITSESKGGEQQLMLQHSDMNKEMRERGVEGQEDLQQEEDIETDQPQPNVIHGMKPLNTQEEGLHMDQQQRDEIRRNSEEDRMQIEARSEMLTQGHEEQNMSLIKEQQQQEEDMETDQSQPNVIQSIEPLNTPFTQSKEAFGIGQKEVQTQNINTDQKMEKEERHQEAASDEDEKETKTEKERPKTENREEQTNKGVSGSTGQKKQKENQREEIKLKTDRERMKSKEKLSRG